MSTWYRIVCLLGFFAYVSLTVSGTPTPEQDRAPASITSRLKCQTLTFPNHLQGCTSDTVLVSKDHSISVFTSIQSAINSLPHDHSPRTILILGGNYTEQLNVTRPGPLTLLGETEHINNASTNKVTVLWSSINGTSPFGGVSDNVYTSVLTVAPTLNSSLTGSGPTGFPVPEDTPFGNTDFKVYNIDFRNVYSEAAAGPSHALSFSRANGGFYYSGFYSYQDTVYIGKLGNAYFYKSIIAGQTDFLYGFGTMWVQSSQVVMRGCGGGVTAWKGTNTTFENKYGVYVVDSTLAAENSTIATKMVKKCALGRPWNSLQRSIFARTYEDGSIIDGGYIDWPSGGVSKLTNQTFMAEYDSYGPGFNLTGRLAVGIDKVLNSSQYEPYNSPAKVFQTPRGAFGNVVWIDQTPSN